MFHSRKTPLSALPADSVTERAEVRTHIADTFQGARAPGTNGTEAIGKRVLKRRSYVGETNTGSKGASWGGSPLRFAGFRALLCTQFLGAFNDNAYKMVVVLLVVGEVTRLGQGVSYLSLAAAVVIIPFLLFSGYAGHVSDVFNKRAVLVATKFVEVGITGLAVLALWLGRSELLMATLFLLATQTTFFSPAKYGIVPEILPRTQLSRANGLLEMSRYLAVIVGTAVGTVMAGAWSDKPMLNGLILMFLACAGALAALGISTPSPRTYHRPFRANPWAEIIVGVRRLASDRALGPAVLGLTCFEFLGALVLLDLFLLGKEVMGLGDMRIGLLAAIVGAGIGLGSVAAGRLSGDNVKTAFVPFGLLGAGFVLIPLAFSSHSYVQTGLMLALLGFAGGFVIVPLNALLQREAGRQEKGHLIATNNFLNMAGVLAASGFLWILRDALQLSADRILLVAGAMTLTGTTFAFLGFAEPRARLADWVLGRIPAVPPINSVRGR